MQDLLILILTSTTSAGKCHFFCHVTVGVNTKFCSLNTLLFFPMMTIYSFSHVFPNLLAAQFSLGKGGVVAIVLVVFLVLLVGVDALCCYTNHCGMLNFLARKLFGSNVPESKSLEEGVFNNTAV